MKVSLDEKTLLDSKQLDLLFELLNTNSPSGCEHQIVKVLRERMSKYCDTETDVIGNLYMKVGNKQGLKVMISAHSDEVGFQVVYIDKTGFVYARDVASIDKQTIPGNVVVALTSQGEIKGVIGKKSTHVINNKDREIVPNICDLWIDFGFESDEEAKQYIQIGDYVTLNPHPQISNNGKRIISKALDNKIGVFVLAEVIKNLSKMNLPINVIGVATVQEEIGCRGGIVAANKIRPDVAFCIDVGIATDIPSMPKQHYGELQLGEGVALIQNANSNELLIRDLVDIAKQHNIPLQTTIGHRHNGGTEAAFIQLTGMGVATANISIPNRYTHSLVEMCDLRDVVSAVKLLTTGVKILCNTSPNHFNLFQ